MALSEDFDVQSTRYLPTKLGHSGYYSSKDADEARDIGRYTLAKQKQKPQCSNLKNIRDQDQSKVKCPAQNKNYSNTFHQIDNGNRKEHWSVWHQYIQLDWTPNRNT